MLVCSIDIYKINRPPLSIRGTDVDMENLMVLKREGTSAFRVAGQEAKAKNKDHRDRVSSPAGKKANPAPSSEGGYRQVAPSTGKQPP